MKKMYCPECGGEIMITRQVPERSWTIKENSLEKADNNIDNDPQLLFHCDNDREHNIYPLASSSSAKTLLKFGQWMEEVEKFYEENVFPHL